MDILTVGQIEGALGTEGEDLTEITDICIDSRKVTKGCLFIAIEGENFDGHDFVKTAFEKGASAALCSRVAEYDGKVIMTDDTRNAFLKLARWYRNRFEIPVIGITGSVGKTTTKEMTACVLSSEFKTVYTKGNLNNDIGVPQMCMQLDSETEAAVFEVGMNHFGEIHRLSETICPTIGMITNIGVSHIENLGSRDGILKAKLELLDGMDVSSPVILNGDDDMLLSAADKIKNPVLLYGINNKNADYRADNIVYGENGSEFDLIWKGKKIHVNVPAAGAHNVLNACAAFAAGDALKITPEKIVSAIAEYVPSGMRQRIVRRVGVTVIEDCYNASPDSVRAALSTLELMKTDGKKIVVLGDMLELGSFAETAHMQCGLRCAESGADLLLAYGDNARYYVKGASENGMAAKFFDNKDALLSELLSCTSDGDIILFKGSRGMKLEEMISKFYGGREE